MREFKFIPNALSSKKHKQNTYVDEDFKTNISTIKTKEEATNTGLALELQLQEAERYLHQEGQKEGKN